MIPKIAAYCPDCRHYNEWDMRAELSCQKCQKKVGELKNPADVFDRCPVCDARQFYVTKDFNQFLGCAVMVGGIVLVPFTFGLSLPVFALIDWLLYRQVPSIIICYRCAAEFKGFTNDEKRFKPFMHHIGLKYDKYR